MNITELLVAMVQIEDGGELKAYLHARLDDFEAALDRVASMERKQKYAAIAPQVGANADVLADLEERNILPSDLNIDGGYVIQGDQRILFVDYINNDARLCKYMPAIFPRLQQQQPQVEKVPPSLPGVRGQERSSEAWGVEYIRQSKAPVIERIKKRFASLPGNF